MQPISLAAGFRKCVNALTVRGTSLKMRYWMALAGATVLVSAGPASARTPEQVAEAALRAAPVWDGHNDVAEILRDSSKDRIDQFDFRDTSGNKPTPEAPLVSQTDLIRLRQGHVGAQ